MPVFAETFPQYLMEAGPGGGSELPEPDASAEAVLFLLEGELALHLPGKDEILEPGGYAYIPSGSEWRVKKQQAGSCPLSLGQESL